MKTIYATILLFFASQMYGQVVGFQSNADGLARSRIDSLVDGTLAVGTVVDSANFLKKSELSVTSGKADSSINLGGGAANSVPFQSATSTTAFHSGFKYTSTDSGLYVGGVLRVGTTSTAYPFYFVDIASVGGVAFAIRSAYSGGTSLVIDAGGGGGADGFIAFQNNGSTSWVIGWDDSDGDKFKIANSSVLETSTVITFTGTTNALFSGSLTTGTPNGGTSADWKLGVYETYSVVTASTVNSIQVDIGGTLHHVLVASSVTP